MEGKSGEVKVYNTAKRESDEIVFPIIESHKFHIRQARTGELQGVPFDRIDKNQRKINRVKALHLIISDQKDMIQIARPTVRWNTLKAWEKKYKNKEDSEIIPFEEVDNDYNKLMKLRKLLSFFDSKIIEADKTKSKEDDFLTQTEDNEDIKIDLTSNFNEMFTELEDTYEEIYIIMIKHEIVSGGISGDDELDYHEQEDLFLERFREA